MEVSCQLHVLVTFPQDEGLLYPVYRRMGGLHSQSGCWNEIHNIFVCDNVGEGKSCSCEIAAKLVEMGEFVFVPYMS
jgi:hypothetical protein